MRCEPRVVASVTNWGFVADRRSQFQVVALPNLYGDILTDEAAEIQGGVGTAGSANIGKSFAMFEAIQGRMIREAWDRRRDSR